MGFSVPPRLRLERWAFTPPFHPYPALKERGGLFSVALSVGKSHDIAARVYPFVKAKWLRGIAPFGVRTFLPYPRFRAIEAILRPSKIGRNIPLWAREASDGGIVKRP